MAKRLDTPSQGLAQSENGVPHQPPPAAAMSPADAEERREEQSTAQAQEEPSLVRSALAELIGAAILIYTGTSAACALLLSPDAPPWNVLAVVLAFGLVLAALVSALGHVSGCHLNPAVTIGLAAGRKFPWSAVPAYVIAQVLGGALGALATWATWGDAGHSVARLAATFPAPGVSDGRAVLVEALVTFILVFVVTSVATDVRAYGGVAPLAVGFALAAGIFIAGPVTGGAVNPARALGPMIVSGTFTSWWVYIVGPVLGGVLAGVLYARVFAGAAPPADD